MVLNHKTSSAYMGFGEGAAQTEQHIMRQVQTNNVLRLNYVKLLLRTTRRIVYL